MGHSFLREAPMTTAPLFEVRIPTFARPDLLRRAVSSLQAQTYPHWRAKIYDDGLTPRGSSHDFKDDRICYQRNHTRLRAFGNIDQCFSPAPQFGGDYACLLEDDNFWLPDFLSLIASKLKSGEWPVILANQRIANADGSLRPKSETTRGQWFVAGAVEVPTLRASLLLMEGLSNGGLIWRLKGAIDLRVGPSVRYTALQEACRSLLLRNGFLFVAEAEAVWTHADKMDSARATESNRVVNRGFQSVREFVLRHDDRKAVEAAILLASRVDCRTQLLRNLAYCGRLRTAMRLWPYGMLQLLKTRAKGCALKFVVEDPCNEFLTGLCKRSDSS